MFPGENLLSGVLWAVKSLVRVVFGLWDNDEPTSDLCRAHSGTAQENSPSRDDSRGCHNYSNPHIAHSHRQPFTNARTPAPAANDGSFHLLPICDREGYEAAREEAKRRLRLQEQHLADKHTAERMRNVSLVERYERILKNQEGIIDMLNAAASKWIYQENNQPGRLQAGLVDLHGLKVAEAIKYAKEAIRDAEARGENRIRLIVGKGKHSDGGVSVLKPTIKQALKSRGRHVGVDPQNAGILVVWLGNIQSDMV